MADLKELQDKLNDLERERLNTKGQLDRERLTQVTGTLIDTLTSPVFIEKMSQARTSADEGGGLEAASKLLSIDGLREAGVDIPKDFRLTSRVFEDRTQGLRFELKSDPRLTGPQDSPGMPEPLGWGICGGGGGLTFCGCAGFSTVVEP